MWLVELNHISLGNQVIVCLTKGLGLEEYNLACNKMVMIDIYHPSEGIIFLEVEGGVGLSLCVGCVYGFGRN